MYQRHSAKCGGITGKEYPGPTLEESGSKVLIISHTADESPFNFWLLVHLYLQVINTGGQI